MSEISIFFMTVVVALWLGMVLAISFLEAPLKFQAPGITIPLGLGIGRIVFQALNGVEVVFALTLTALFFFSDPAIAAQIATVIAVAALAAQLVFVRPKLAARSDEILRGTAVVDGPSSHAHWWYVGIELIKVVALISTLVALGLAM